MSNFKKLIIPAIVLALLVGAYLIVTNLPEKEDEGNTNTSQEKIQIFDFVKNDLSEIIMENNDEVLHFKYTTIQVEQETTKDDGTVETKMVDRNVWFLLSPKA